MKLKVCALSPLFALIGLVFCSGCSLEPANQKTAMLQIALPHFPKEEETELELFQSPFTLANNPPSAVSGFNCLAVNVMGPNIASVSGDGGAGVLGNLLAQPPRSYCSYAGITSKPISLGGPYNVELHVPTGPSRLVQVVGIVNGNTNPCSAGGPIGTASQQTNAGGPSTDGYFEVGRAVIDLFSDSSVTITNNWNSLSNTDKTFRQLNCGDRSLPISSALHSSTTCLLTIPPSVGTVATAFSLTRYLQQDGLAEPTECVNGSGGKQWEEYAFDPSSYDTSQYNNLYVNWRGTAGKCTTTCSGQIPSTVNGQIYIYDYSLPAWVSIGSVTNTTEFAFVGGTPANSGITRYIHSDGKIHVGISGDTATASIASNVQTDYVGVFLKK